MTNATPMGNGFVNKSEEWLSLLHNATISVAQQADDAFRQVRDAVTLSNPGGQIDHSLTKHSLTEQVPPPWITTVNGATDWVETAMRHGQKYGATLVTNGTATPQTAVAGVIDRSKQWGDGVAMAFQDAFSNPWERWLTNHPLLNWLVSHPLWAIAMLVVLAVLLRGFFRAIAQFSEQLWLALLNAPLRLMRWLLDRSLTPFKSGIAPAKPRLPPADREKLASLVNRLEVMRQEQEELMREIKTLLTSD